MDDFTGIRNMITDEPGFPALAAFDAGQLFGFAVIIGLFGLILPNKDRNDLPR